MGSLAGTALDGSSWITGIGLSLSVPAWVLVDATELCAGFLHGAIYQQQSQK